MCGDCRQSQFQMRGDDEPAHFVLMYTPLFLLFYLSFSITEPLPCTMLSLALNYTIYHFCYQTSFMYQMDRWPMGCTVAFPFLILFSYLMMYPVVGQLVTSHCTAWSGDLLLFHHRWALCWIPWLSFIFILPVFYCRIVNQIDVFPQSSDLGSSLCLIALCPLLWCTFTLPCMFTAVCTFTSLHFASFPCLTLPHPTVLLSLPVAPYLETVPYLLITPSEPHWAYILIELYCSLFLI